MYVFTSEPEFTMINCCRDLQVSRKRMTKDLMLINALCLVISVLLMALPRWHQHIIIHHQQPFMYCFGLIVVSV